MANIYGTGIVTTDLVFYLDAGNLKSYTGSGTTWGDISGNTRAGTLTLGPTYTSGVSGYFSFDGVDDHVNMSTQNLQRNFTLEIWAYVTGDGCGLFGQGVFATSQGLHILWNSTASRGMIFGMYGNDLDSPAYTMVFNTWHQFTFTYNHTTFLKQFYADGVLINSGANAAYAGTGQFNIGAIYGTPSSTMKGRIANTKMYSAVLTASQVLQNFNAQRTRYGI